MYKRKGALKKYFRKFKHLKRKEKVYVEKVLIITGIISVVLLAMIITVIIFGINKIHVKHFVQDNFKSEKEYSSYLRSKEDKISVADELNISEDEANLLARLVNAEAGGESREAQVAVASVVLNRVESNLFPDSIHDVIYQEGQYECVINGAIEKEPTEMATESAYYVYQNGSQIPCTVLYQAEFVQGNGVWAEIDGEYFCY